MKTSGYVQQGLPNPDGHIYIDPQEYCYPTDGGLSAFRSGVGLVGVTIPASATTTISFGLDSLLYRYGMQDDSEMQFGQNNGTSGAQALPLLPGTNYQTPYSTQARPPIASTALFGSGTGTAAVIPKGITFKSVNFSYQVLGAGLTSATLGLTKTQYASGSAPVVTNLIPAANNGIALAVAAQPVVSSVPVPVAAQVMQTSRLAKYLLEFIFVAPAGSTVQFSGIYLDVAYNFN